MAKPHVAPCRAVARRGLSPGDVRHAAMRRARALKQLQLRTTTFGPQRLLVSHDLGASGQMIGNLSPRDGKSI
jgi:hypothetical protein